MSNVSAAASNEQHIYIYMWGHPSLSIIYIHCNGGARNTSRCCICPARLGHAVAKRCSQQCLPLLRCIRFASAAPLHSLHRQRSKAEDESRKACGPALSSRHTARQIDVAASSMSATARQGASQELLYIYIDTTKYIIRRQGTPCLRIGSLCPSHSAEQRK